jgi:amino acid transporter
MSQPLKFGTLKGVYIPSILTILGIVMYLRMGWMVAHVGIIGSIAIITIASAITFLTSLSIASTATNMRVGAGGAYYMISRSFGIETGAAIGIPLFFAQSLGIAFYISGFTEAVTHVFPWIPSIPLSLLALSLLFWLCYVSADLTLKIQFFIFFLMIVSLISFFLGQNNIPSVDPNFSFVREHFWAVFAVIFPALTGIEAGLSMSGDLKDPSRSLPRGTIWAVLSSYVIYLAIPVFLYIRVPTDVLATNFMVMENVATVGALLILGVWVSALSSAVGALMGAPRTLQALAKDRILFSFFSKVSPQGLPQRATIVSFLIALVTLLLGDLNSIAAILSMFFLTSYSLINLATFSEAFMRNPSWRPSFKVSWLVPLLGFALCVMAMLLINSGAAMIAFSFTLIIYFWTQKRNLGKRWSDIRRGMLMNAARNIIYKLAQSKADARSWRPNIVVFSGSPSQRFPLVDLGRLINSGHGFLTVCSIIAREHLNFERKKSLESSMQMFFSKKNVKALAEVHFAESPSQGVMTFSENYGIGPLKPNLFIFGQSKNESITKEFARSIIPLHQLKRNLIVLRNHTQGESGIPRVSNQIHIWWNANTQNASLMLTLAYMVSTNPDRKKTKLYLKTFIRHEDEREKNGSIHRIYLEKCSH